MSCQFFLYMLFYYGSIFKIVKICFESFIQDKFDNEKWKCWEHFIWFEYPHDMVYKIVAERSYEFP